VSKRKFRLHDGKTGSALAVRVTPRANRNRIAEVMSDGTVRIHLTAAPVDGEANEKLIAFLAKTLDIAKSRIEIVAGSSGRDKLISIVGMDAATLHARISANVD
jgi:uncharacterized protein (TIGR00251 family)